MGDQTENDPQPLTETLAAAVRTFRARNHLTQTDLAAVMTALGNKWTDTTVSKVEQDDRAVSAVELISLGLALQVPVANLVVRWEDQELEVALGGFVLRSSTLHDAVSDGPTMDYFTDPGRRPSWLEMASRRTDDTAAVAWVTTELSRWEQAQELLRHPVTERGRRAKEAALWADYENRKSM